MTPIAPNPIIFKALRETNISHTAVVDKLWLAQALRSVALGGSGTTIDGPVQQTMIPVPAASCRARPYEIIMIGAMAVAKL